MYGLETIQNLNRKNAEAAAIMAKHEQPLPDPTDTVRQHLAHAQETKDRILNGAKG